MANRELVLELGSFQEVLDRCATRLSEEGLYFETTEDGAVGSEVKFEVRIRDSFSVLRGEGEIVRATDEGVYVRLAYLDQPSLKLLPKLVEHFRRQGVPLLELPEVETAEMEEAEEPPAAAAELSADDLWPEEEDRPAKSPVVLTLDDLEAEFLSKKGSGLVEEDLSAETDVEPFLVDPRDLIADTPENQEAFAPDDIHLNELLTAAEAAGQESNPEAAPELQIDPGLPWLSDEEPEKRSRKDLWLILVLIVLGAALGVAFYFFFLRPGDDSSQVPAEPVEHRARAVPASSPIVDPAPMAMETVQLPPEAQADEVVQAKITAAPKPAEPRPRPPEPSAGPLTGVDRVTWNLESGETVVTFWADGLFVAEQVDDFRVVDGAPREVVRIRGIQRPFAQQQVELDTAHVLRIRVGLHEESEGAALHFVADLADDDVEIQRTEAVGEQLRVYFSKAG